MKKEFQYTAKINMALASLFDKESDCYIDTEELQEGNNATLFFHALATLAPCYIYNKLGEKEIDALEFNHFANNLCFQFLNKD